MERSVAVQQVLLLGVESSPILGRPPSFSRSEGCGPISATAACVAVDPLCSRGLIWLIQGLIGLRLQPEIDASILPDTIH